MSQIRIQLFGQFRVRRNALPIDHTYPEPGGVIVSSPNAINSPLLGPSGSCS